MRTAAIVCNVVVLTMTGVILLTEGVPRHARYLVLTLLVLLVPLFTAVVLVRERIAPPGSSTDSDRWSTMTLTNRAVVLCNLVLLGASCWESVAQYPYPEGNSVIPFAVLTICAPILSLMALLGGGRRSMRERRRSTAGADEA
jgi:hypothetical protein